MPTETWAPPAIPDEPVEEGSRWRHHKPSSAAVASWFATQPLDEGMRHEDYIGGVVLIPQREKVKFVSPDGREVERHEQVFTPYVQIGTRVGYFRRLAQQRDLISVIAPADDIPLAKNPNSLYFNANMDKGLWWHVISDSTGTTYRYLCATWIVELYDRQSFADRYHGREAMPLLQGRGTKQVGGGPDPNMIAKAQTGAVGRALGVAGVLVIGTGIACLPRRAEILTREGFKRYDEVDVGDDVLAYDAASDRTRWTPLRKISVFGEALVISLRSQSFSAICTADHKWAIRRKHIPASGPAFELREAQDIGRGGPSLVVAAPTEPGDHPLSPRDAAVLGWLATDGHIDYKVKAGSPRATITQNKPEHVARLRELLGDDATERTTDAGWQEIKGAQCWVRQRHDFRLRAEAFASLKVRAGIERLEELPALASRLDKRAREAMLEAMLAADGHRRGGGWVFTKGKRWVLDLFQMLCTLEGLAMGSERALATSAATQIHVRSSRFVDAAKLRVTPEFPEPVWCPTTDYGTWVARLDGQVFVTGNTAEDMLELPGYGAEGAAPAPSLPPPVGGVPSELPEGQQPSGVDEREALHARALELQTRLQEAGKWPEVAAWYAERAKAENWNSLRDAPIEGLKAVVAYEERALHAEAEE